MAFFNTTVIDMVVTIWRKFSNCISAWHAGGPISRKYTVGMGESPSKTLPETCGRSDLPHNGMG